MSTGIGGHIEGEEAKGDAQFEINDNASVDYVYREIEEMGMQPVMSDYIYV